MEAVRNGCFVKINVHICSSRNNPPDILCVHQGQGIRMNFETTLLNERSLSLKTPHYMLAFT
jgi:hypothetical protein